MWGSAMLAMDVSSTCMNVASITPSAISHGLWRGRHSSWEAISDMASGYREAPASLRLMAGRNPAPAPDTERDATRRTRRRRLKLFETHAIKPTER